MSEQREVEIIENDNDLTIIIPRIGNWLVILMAGIWCLGWIYALVLMAKDGMLIRDTESMWYTLAFSLVWIFVLKSFLWNVRGKEKISLNEEYLRISRIGTFLTSTNRFEVSLIDDFKLAEQDDTQSWSKLYGFAGGLISFNYWERPEYFGQTVSKNDAKEIISRLNERLEKLRTLNKELI